MPGEKQKLHPAEAGWRKPPMTRVEHGTLPVRGERSRASQPLRHGGLFDISLFFPPYVLPYRPRNPMERARVSGNFPDPRVVEACNPSHLTDGILKFAKRLFLIRPPGSACYLTDGIQKFANRFLLVWTATPPGSGVRSSGWSG